MESKDRNVPQLLQKRPYQDATRQAGWSFFCWRVELKNLKDSGKQPSPLPLLL
jgi:hypothetical protein